MNALPDPGGRHCTGCGGVVTERKFFQSDKKATATKYFVRLTLLRQRDMQGARVDLVFL
jgi:hypothetical protein